MDVNDGRIIYERPFTDEEYLEARAVKATPTMWADCWHTGVLAYLNFIAYEMRPAIIARGRARSLRERAILDIWGAMQGFLLCIRDLDETINVQGVGACSRSIFELYNDLLLIAYDDTQNTIMAQRYLEFGDVEKFRAAKEEIKFFQEHPEFMRPEDIAPLVEWVDEEKQSGRLDRVVAEFWEGKQPSHFSGIRRGKDRAKKAGLECEANYWQYYARLSWLVHTASVGTFGMSEEQMDGVRANAMELVRRVTIPTMRGLCSEFDLPIEDVGNKIEFLNAAFIFRLVALQLGQPGRFEFKT